jgi:hypothetical protein
MRTIISNNRFNKVMHYVTKREFKATPHSSARNFWKSIGEGIRENYTTRILGETV